ncbi:MAG: hypothetical protein SFV18_19285 [Bryobacteraceae bacterium]|nr:hypothetical protein [Bryobacteraceae bacterium]
MLAARIFASLTLLFLGIALAPRRGFAQSSAPPKKAPVPVRAAEPENLGQSYAVLRPKQKRLVDDFVRRYNETTKSQVKPEAGYDGARLSIRTTFDAVTHALLEAKLTAGDGTSLGSAIDLIEAVDEVMGEVRGLGGDRQFRLYVYLKPGAAAKLDECREFARSRDNTIYHKGFPICYRLRNGPPSIQFSISRDHRMADIDVDYRSSSFPRGLFNGHLTAANSDVRAGNNLQRHENRWTGLNGWWREVFGLLGSGGKAKEERAEGIGNIPLNPALKADRGIDASVHDFLKSWVIDRQPNLSAAYFSRRSYACLERIADRNRKPMAPGMVRLRTAMALRNFGEKVGAPRGVEEVFQAPAGWSPDLKEAKNAYPAEFKLVSVPPETAAELECAAVAEGEKGGGGGRYYAAAFQAKNGDARHSVISTLWGQENGFWKMIAVRIEDAGGAGIVPKKSAVASPAEAEATAMEGDPQAVRSIDEFYRAWAIDRDTARAAGFASAQSYACLDAPSAAERKMSAAARIRSGLSKSIERVAKGTDLAGMMSAVDPVNALLRPVTHPQSSAFSIMGVPAEMAASFVCQTRRDAEPPGGLKPIEATYGAYYLSASRLNYEGEDSPALLLLWAKDRDRWKVAAWAVEVP